MIEQRLLVPSAQGPDLLPRLNRLVLDIQREHGAARLVAAERASMCPPTVTTSPSRRDRM